MVADFEGERMTLPDAPNESDTERDGVLSYAGEWHALAIGAGLGIFAAATMNEVVFVFAFLLITGKAKVSNSHLKDAAKEAAYTSAAFVGAFGAWFLLF